MRWMKGRRALAGGLLVLALSCAIPAISAAQEAGTTTDGTTTDATTTTTVPTPPNPGPPADRPNNPSKPAPQTAPPTGPGAGTPGESPPVDGGAADSALAGDSPPASRSGGARKAASASVTMGDLFFSPASVTVAVGDTVTWNNTGQAPHNATADDGSFKTPTIENGQSASHTFNQAGTFSYICTIHPNMHGTVRVLASSSGGGGGGGGGNAGGASSSSSSSGSSTSESTATASPGAAGDANTLPMTGMAVGGLALVGLGLVALGLIARLAERDRSRLRWFSIF